MNEESKVQELQIYSCVMTLHAKALACHCECLGMNAANSHAVCLGYSSIPYNESHYLCVMEKWGLVDANGNPKI